MKTRPAPAKGEPSGVVLSTVMSTDYERNYATAMIKRECLGQIVSRAGQILTFRDQYDKVEKGTGVPWFVVGCMHSLESDLNFTKHLHNGDPLTDYTVHVPAGHPKVGHPPPFAWYESATDALNMMGHPWRWGLAECLWFIESFNGMGYRKHNCPSPYLWSMSNFYTMGKYTADGIFNAALVSDQIGAVCLLKIFEQRGLISLPLGK